MMTPSMDLRTFGGVTLGEGAFTRPKPLLLLAYLAVEGPQDRRFLAELFWPEAAQPRRSLAVALARLKRAAPDAVDVADGKVACAARSDAEAFFDHVERGEPMRAVELYRGPFLDGIDPVNAGAELEEWLYGTRELLSARASKAMLAVAEREAGLGRFEGAGRRAATALGWVDPFVLEPEELVRMHTVLRAGDHPRAAELGRTVAGFDLDLAGSVDDARARMAPARVSSGARTLPAPATAFVGRDLELTEVASVLAEAEGRLLTLVGPPGAGKTRLALQVAREQLATGAHRDGVHVVPLEAVRDPDQVPAAIAEALGVRPSAGSDPLASVVAELRDAETLLVVDNVEHLAPGAAALGELVRACARVRILATSRERLNLQDERVFVLSGMSVPEGTPELEEARRTEAVRLFVQRAKRARPDFELDADTLPHVLHVCRTLEGLPLLLELAAAWARVMPCEAIAREIAGDLDLLSRAAHDVPERHRSLRHAFEHSWRLLTPTERDVLARLSVFQGGFERGAAREIAGATLPVLASLVDKSLLRVSPTWRFDRHPLLHAFTEEKLAEDPDARRLALGAHAIHYARRLEALEGALDADGSHQAEALRFIDDEGPNVRAAWRWMVRHGRSAALARGSEAFHRLLQHRGRHREGATLLREALAGIEAGDADDRWAAGALRTALAVLVYHLGDLAEAEAIAKEGLTGLGEEAYGPEVHRGINTLALVAWRRGAHGEARRHWEQALAQARADDDPVSTHIYLVNLAMVERSEGDLDRAAAYLREALELTRALDHRVHTALALNNLGELAYLRGDLDGAEPHLEEALQVAREVGASDLAPMCRLNLALVAFENDALDRAARHTEEALEQVRDSGQRALEIGAVALTGRIAAAQGRDAQARESFRACLRSLRASPATSLVLKVLAWLAEWQARGDRPERAVPILDHVVRHPSTDPDDRRSAQRWLRRALRAARAERPEPGIEDGLELDRLVERVSRDVLA